MCVNVADFLLVGENNTYLWSGPGVVVRTLVYHAEDLGSNPTPDKLTKCEFFLRKRSKTWVPRWTSLGLKISLIQIIIKKYLLRQVPGQQCEEKEGSYLCNHVSTILFFFLLSHRFPNFSGELPPLSWSFHNQSLKNHKKKLSYIFFHFTYFF